MSNWTRSWSGNGAGAESCGGLGVLVWEWGAGEKLKSTVINLGANV